jgi:hypothetical protein
MALAIVSFAALAAPAPARGQGEPTAGGPSRAERARLVEDLFAREPASAAVIAEAMRYFELHPEDLAHLGGRLRSKAGAPYLVVAERLQRNSVERDLAVFAPDRVVRRRVADRVDVWRSSTTGILSWDTPAAVMSDAELQTYQLALVQRQVIATVNVWLYSRRILLLELLVDPPRDPRALSSLRIRVEGFTALLDTYTGGWYGRQLPEIPAQLRPNPPGATPGGDKG